MMGHREEIISGDEFDAFGARGRHRQKLLYLKKPGAVRKIKARFNRRIRHHAKLATKALKVE